jgi:poly-gamma-glutamate capsule biosynthesis protein CapA/YwtB (metallophosphatase superfamily)
MLLSFAGGPPRPVPPVLLLVALFGLSLPAPARAQEDPSGSLSGDGRMTMALTGDAIITRSLSPYKEPEFLGMVELLRSADLAFTNLEVLLHDYEPSPAAQSGGTYMRSPPAMAQELKWAGIDMVSLANNHTGDYGAEGMRITIRHLDAAGLLHAGAGENLHEAREARFLETHDGRVALISMSSTFPDHSRAGAARGAVKGRPGLSPLRIQTTRTVERARLEELRGVLRAMGQDVSDAGQPLNVFGTTLTPGDVTAVRTAPHARDMEELANVVRNASQLADYVIVTIHAHNQSEYLQVFARAMVDAGADVFVGHGPHYLTGIEIYKGKPIMYSLGDFIFQNETLLRLPFDNYDPYEQGYDLNMGVADFNRARYANETRGFPTNREIWESVVALPTFEDGRLLSLELHPITLGFGQPAQIRGRPMFADRDLGQKIIQDLIDRSEPHGTRVEWDASRGIGVVRIP